MGFCVGRDCKVVKGSGTVLGIGTFSISGVQIDQLETTAFDNASGWKSFVVGLKDGGTISFDGLYDPLDTGGQGALITAADAATDISDLKFYVNSTQYWTPTTTNPSSYINITSYSVSADKSGLAQISFQGKVSGKMALV